jgi:hypothetical protein
MPASGRCMAVLALLSNGFLCVCVFWVGTAAVVADAGHPEAADPTCGCSTAALGKMPSMSGHVYGIMHMPLPALPRGLLCMDFSPYTWAEPLLPRKGSCLPQPQNFGPL